MENLLTFLIGLIFVGGGALFVKGADGARNFYECTLFGLFGIGIGLFLCGAAIFGAPP